ncbi:hypothetical protein ACFXO2_02345 [Streptomyces sp. NPDC059152]|uniref:hypothetical protein n=1 Tax=Streptomyces sp. NPDC059152 TaxID=3346742 RepID=UPI003676F62B
MPFRRLLAGAALAVVFIGTGAVTASTAEAQPLHSLTSCNDLYNQYQRDRQAAMQAQQQGAPKGQVQALMNKVDEDLAAYRAAGCS